MYNLTTSLTYLETQKNEAYPIMAKVKILWFPPKMYFNINEKMVTEYSYPGLAGGDYFSWNYWEVH